MSATCTAAWGTRCQWAYALLAALAIGGGGTVFLRWCDRVEAARCVRVLSQDDAGARDAALAFLLGREVYSTPPRFAGFRRRLDPEGFGWRVLEVWREETEGLPVIRVRHNSPFANVPELTTAFFEDGTIVSESPAREPSTVSGGISAAP